jgi:clan AA aspartic protease (TIGR02281 family)
LQSDFAFLPAVAARIACVAAMMLQACFADIVYLKKGGWVEGVIIKQTKETVTVDLGFGTTEIEAADIDRIEKADKATQRSLQQQWSSDFFSQSRFVPERFRPTADSLSELSQERSRALRWKERLDRLERRRIRKADELDSLHKALVSASRKVKNASPHGNVRAYNNLVASVHSIRADMDIKQHELSGIRKELDSGNPSLADYMEKFDAFKRYMARKKRRTKRLNADEKKFCAQTDARIAEFEKDFETTKIDKPQRIGKHFVVTAKINNRTKGKFLLDTGASIVSFSKAFADRLGVNVHDVPAIEVVLADGSRVAARPLILRSVAVNDMVVSNVQAVVLEKPPGSGVDGLLGMSYLGKFFIHIDVQTNTLELKRFAGN